MQEVMEKPVTDEQEAAQRVIEVINVAPKAIKTEEQYTRDWGLWQGNSPRGSNTSSCQIAFRAAGTSLIVGRES